MESHYPLIINQATYSAWDLRSKTNLCYGPKIRQAGCHLLLPELRGSETDGGNHQLLFYFSSRYVTKV